MGFRSLGQFRISHVQGFRVYDGVIRISDVLGGVCRIVQRVQELDRA